MHEYRSAVNVFKKRRNNYQTKSIIFEIISKTPTKGQSNQLPFRLHCTIRFSIDVNVNILSPNSKNYTYKVHQTCLILKFHHSQLVSINNIPHVSQLNPALYPFTLTYYQQPCSVILTPLQGGTGGKNQSGINLVPEFIMLKGFIQTANGPSF